MNPVNTVIIEVDEKEEELVEGSSFLVKDKMHGSIYDGAVQHGVIKAADKNSGLKPEVKVWFHHRLVDTEKRKEASMFGKSREELQQLGSFRNYDWSNFGIKDKAYVVEKGSEGERVGWGEWILATEENGKVKPYKDYSICKPVEKPTLKSDFITLDFKSAKGDEPNILEVVESNIYNKGTHIIKKKDGDYPMDINGEQFIFIKNRNVFGKYQDGKIKLNSGWVLIEANDEKHEWRNDKGVLLHNTQNKEVKKTGTVFMSALSEIESGDKVHFNKSSYQLVELDNKKYYAVDESQINLKYL